MAETVRAAGGVVWRRRDALVEALLVHRPRYEDWTLPKGKCLPEESDEDCALREVEEETGLRCSLGEELSQARYRDGKGRPKIVRFWALRPLGGEFVPGDEVDEVRWLSLDEAGRTLSYERERDVLATFAPPSDTVLLVRHASAGDRRSWDGDDRERPLDERGRRQAEGLVPVLRPFAPDRVLTSPYRRCVETVEPLAAELELPVEARDELAEGAGREAALALTRELAGAAPVLCTHGDVIEELVGAETKKGATAVLERRNGDVRLLEVLPSAIG